MLAFELDVNQFLWQRPLDIVYVTYETQVEEKAGFSNWPCDVWLAKCIKYSNLRFRTSEPISIGDG